MESKQELETKLHLYKGQLDQVNDLLLVDSESPEFLKLKDDLTNVISLTKNLIDQVYTSQNEQRSEGNLEDDIAEIEKFSIKKQSKSTLVRTGAIAVGENVEVTGGDRLYAGTVVEVISDSEYKIKYFEFDSIVSLPASSLLRIDINNPPQQQLESYEVEVGLQCQSKYALDLQYYDCVVTGITKNGYNITYTQYGNAEEVPLEYLRLTPSADESTKAHASSSGVSGVKRDGSGLPVGGNKKIDSNGLIIIPENLKILPTDTEEV